MYVSLMNDAAAQAERDVRAQEWAADWLTGATWVTNRAVSSVLSVLLLIPDIVISIPRAILASVPIINIPYVLIGQLLYMVLLGPTYATSWVWREVRILRPLVRIPLVLIGLPFAWLGTIYASVWLMGGPQEGPNKLHKKAIFESWPLTVDFVGAVSRYYPVEQL